MKILRLATPSVLLSLSGMSAMAAEYEFDSFTVNWDSSISVGTQFRIEKRNERISKGSTGDIDDLPLVSLPGIIDNAFILCTTQSMLSNFAFRT